MNDDVQKLARAYITAIRGKEDGSYAWAFGRLVSAVTEFLGQECIDEVHKQMIKEVEEVLG